MQRSNESVDVFPGVVEREGCAHGCRYAEVLHHGLRAVVAGPHRNALVVEDRSDIVGVHSVERKRHDRGPLRCRSDQPQTRNFGQRIRRVGTNNKKRRLIRCETTDYDSFITTNRVCLYGALLSPANSWPMMCERLLCRFQSGKAGISARSGPSVG